MSIDKFKQLHDLVINEDTDAARELFHEIVLEKSRSIFESMMHDDEEDMEEGMGGQVGDMLDEINAEESGMMEDDDTDIDFGDDDDDMDGLGDVDDMDELGAEDEEHEEIEDAVIRIEDKLDQLMAEFEEIMGSEEGEEEEDFDAEEEDFDDEEEDFDDEEQDFDDEEEDEEAMMENVQLQKVPVTHGDDGAQKKSTVAFNSGQSGMASKPVKFSGDTEAVPTSPKGPSNQYSKGETSVKHSSEWKNAPGKKTQDLSAAPKAKGGDDGVNKRSPVAESRKSVRKAR